MTPPAPLRLFWWKAVPNFGDALSRVVVGHMSGRPVEHARAGQCDLFAIGSVLEIARRNHRRPRRDGTRPWVWGSGVLRNVQPDFVKHVDVALVRGPVSAALLRIRTTAFGDPALLVDEIIPAMPREDRVGIVPHHSQADDPRLAALVASDPKLMLIDARRPAEELCRAISACAHVAASSLHGLVVADAYGVPSTWFDPETDELLKFQDYAASVERSLPVPIPIADLKGALRKLPDLGSLAYAHGIARSRDDLKTHFPAQLRASADMVSA
ncbi:MAG: polysaccharide pyruvyl transferase family protein [Pseudomonadota bacterium]